MSTGGIPLHESQQVYGVSEDCKFNDHTMCRSSRCGCSCHRQRQVATDSNDSRTSRADIISPIQTGLDKYCPKCKVKASSEQNFCTIDGYRLSSLRCPECGTPGEQSHIYCGYCGSSMKATDSQLEAAAVGDVTGSGTAEVNDEISAINNAEAAMRAALGQSTVKTVPAPVRPGKISVGMFK